MVIFETKRLKVRKLELGDLNSSLEHRLDKVVSQFIALPLTREGETAKFMQRLEIWQEKDGEWAFLAIIQKEKNKLIGELAFRYVSKASNLMEIGYRLSSNSQRVGYGFEVVKPFLEYLFSKYQLNKIIAICDVDNHASYKLMEKLGMSREAHFIQHTRRGETYYDDYVYSIRKLINPI